MVRDWTGLIGDGIPLARAMQIDAALEPDGRVRLIAPLAPNVNDKGTGFGGSIVTLATVAGWVEIQRQLDVGGVEAEVEIVVQQGETRYLQPVVADFSALVEVPDPDGVDRFLRMFRKRGVARLAVSIQVHCLGAVCATFLGEYVATRALTSE
jgi:thioesterase domain-containing protein